MREYERTHPWVTFGLDLRVVPYDLWIALGEAQSKCEHISGTPLKPAIAEELHKVFLAKGIRATTSIEGNTLTEEEVRKRIDGQLELPLSREYLGKEVDNMLKAINRVTDDVIRGERIGISLDEIMAYNRQILEGLALEEGVVPGELRTYNVTVGKYRGVPPKDCEYLLTRLCDWVNKEFVPLKGQEIIFGVIKAIVSHLYLAWIHPFGDGNGRTARLVEFKLLLEAGTPTPAAHLLSNHYNQTRTEYYRMLDHASKSGGDVIPFMSYAVKGYVDGLREQIETIRHQHLEVSWTNFVHDAFRNRTSPASARQRHLVLDLSTKGSAIPFDQIRTLSTRTAEAYAGKTRKTVTRDLNELERMNLVEWGKDGIKARVEQILAFLPAKRPLG
jgi:Fic family protein